MKILHIIPTLGTGGAEKMLVDIANQQIARGHEVSIFVQKPGSYPLLSELAKECKVNLGLGKSLYSTITLISTLKFIYGGKFDIIHSHLTFSQFSTSIADRLLLCRGASLITTEHNTHNKRRNNKIFKILDAFIYSRYRFIICISQATMNNLSIWLPFTTETLVKVSNGIKLTKYMDAQPAKLDLPRPIIISVSRFDEQKDHETLINAFAKMNQGTLLLVGDGVRRKEMESLVTSLGVENRAKFLGIRFDIPELLKSSDIFVQSSHWEGFGISTIEAMAAGLPVIVSDVAGLNDVVGSAGLKFPAGQPAALAAALVDLNDVNTRDELSAKSVVKAAQYDISKTVDKYLALYDLARLSSLASKIK